MSIDEVPFPQRGLAAPVAGLGAPRCPEAGAAETATGSRFADGGWIRRAASRKHLEERNSG